MIDRALGKSLIAIPSINGGHLLERALPTLRVPPDIVLVIDQGSTDHTESVCHAAGVSVLQLGTRHTYTEACNIGAQIARKRDCEFLFVGNNDIAFRTDVVRELLAEMLADDGLGIVAPSQLLIQATGQRRLVHRVHWDLQNGRLGADDRLPRFEHDDVPPIGNPERIESDFCELTFALVRMSAIDAVGFLDNAYGFYHEDADFGYRLRQHGYSCAYLPHSQIEHFTGSTFEDGLTEQRREYLQRSKELFARKFLGYAFGFSDQKTTDVTPWSTVNRDLHRYLSRFGLIGERKPKLSLAYPGTEPTDYLYTAWEATELPKPWLQFKHSYQAVFATSHWAADVLRDNGFQPVFYAPLGVEPDMFHPWGPRQRLFDETTFLWLARNQFRKGLDVALKAWTKFRQCNPSARLVLAGTGMLAQIPYVPSRSYQTKNSIVSDYDGELLSVFEITHPLTDEELATLYRGVDFTICSSRSEGFGLVVAESMACGTPSICGGYAATGEFSVEGALLLRGGPAMARYDDKGLQNVESWWEPDTDHLALLLRQAYEMEPTRYRELARRGINLVRTRYTWRSTVMALRAGLVATQQNYPPGVHAPYVPFESEASAPPRHRFAARNVKRLGLLLASLGDQWQTRGGRAAVSELSTRVSSYMCTRFMTARSKLIAALGNIKLPGPTTVTALRFPMLRAKGILLVGYAEGDLDLGQSFRNLISAIVDRKLTFRVYPLKAGVGSRMTSPFMPRLYDSRHTYDINVIEISTDQIATVFASHGPRGDNYNVLRTYWDLPEAPSEWKPMLSAVHEIWTPNEFSRSAFLGVFPGPIRVIPPHICVDPLDENVGRPDFGLLPGRFYFLSTFDYGSSFYRNNPMSAIAAFQDAFPVLTENVGLVLKSTGADKRFAHIGSEVDRHAERDPRIITIDEAMPRPRLLGLIRACDCYVSLHRAEGLGLGMAEAMALGKAVVGTNFSGSTDFLTEETGFPIGYDLRRVEPHEYYWSRGQIWAEPHHAAAVATLRQVFADPLLRAQRGQNGQALMRSRYGKEFVGASVERRICEIAASRSNRPADEF